MIAELTFLYGYNGCLHETDVNNIVFSVIFYVCGVLIVAWQCSQWDNKNVWYYIVWSVTADVISPDVGRNILEKKKE